MASESWSSLRFDFDISALGEEMSKGAPGLLDGERLAAGMREQVDAAVDRLEEVGVVPNLAVVRVGQDPASRIYVQNKLDACQEVGLRAREHHLDAGVSQAELHERLKDIAGAPEVDGMLLQVPLPGDLDPQEALEYIEPDKDVDGFHPRNLGRLMAGTAPLEACTPRGIMTMLRAADVPVQGRNAVVVGRSRTVGRPMAQMLMRADATVTVCHRHTADLESEVERAEILVVAAGVPELVRGEWIREGAVVVDVGITRRDDGSLCGDVEFEEARERASLVTPVPGGVGPVTVASLLRNVVIAACLRRGLSVGPEGVVEDE